MKAGKPKTRCALCGKALSEKTKFCDPSHRILFDQLKAAIHLTNCKSIAGKIANDAALLLILNAYRAALNCGPQLKTAPPELWPSDNLTGRYPEIT